jgi:cobalamin biosynthesis Mg chelatase CobN
MNLKENAIERDARVMRLYEQLVEIEQRLIPTGLHVFGRPSELQEKADLLRMVVSFDRPEHGARALPKLVAEALGIDAYDALLHETSASETRDLIELISYLTPPIENAGLYKGLVSLKDLIGNYRRATDEAEREQLFEAIVQQSQKLNFKSASAI